MKLQSKWFTTVNGYGPLFFPVRVLIKRRGVTKSRAVHTHARAHTPSHSLPLAAYTLADIRANHRKSQRKFCSRILYDGVIRLVVLPEKPATGQNQQPAINIRQQAHLMALSHSAFNFCRASCKCGLIAIDTLEQCSPLTTQGFSNASDCSSDRVCIVIKCVPLSHAPLNNESAAAAT